MIIIRETLAGENNIRIRRLYGASREICLNLVDLLAKPVSSRRLLTPVSYITDIPFPAV